MREALDPEDEVVLLRDLVEVVYVVLVSEGSVAVGGGELAGGVILEIFGGFHGAGGQREVLSARSG